MLVSRNGRERLVSSPQILNVHPADQPFRAKRMNFASDNWAGAHPAIAAALAEHASGFAAAYGASQLDRRVEQRFSETFERDVAVYFVSTGTAANSLSMAAVARPGGVAFAHREAHMLADEGGAPEYLTGGARLCPVDGELGRIDPAALDRAIRRYPAEFIHAGQPMAASITQTTEVGTAYRLDEIAAIAAVCSVHSVPLHMDGARFANALVSLGCTPAEMTWKSGVDILSFGGTKNGCWCAEALVVLNPEIGRDLPFLHKRAAQLFSKARFVSAQFDAYFAKDLWLDSARHANAMAARLAATIEASGKLRLAWQPDANEVFAIMDVGTREMLAQAGAVFHDWHQPQGHEGVGEGEVLCRFVTSFATSCEDIDRFAELLA
jgi:threonine aldolase